MALLVIAASTILVYSNTFHASFHFDDIPSIVENQNLRDLHSQWPPLGSRYLGYLSFALNYRLGGLEVFGYHLTNLLIHVCNGLLIFWLTAITLRTPALRHAQAGPLLPRYLPLTAGLLFALHPIQTQAVTYIVQRFASLATLFFLLSVALYARARIALDGDSPLRLRARALYGLSIVTAAAAMKTKEISFTLPFVVAGYEWLFFRRQRRLCAVIPLAVIAALLLPLDLLTPEDRKLADLFSEGSHFAAEAPEIPRTVYFLTQSRVVATYLRLFLLPIGQNFDHDIRLSSSLADPRVLFAVAILGAVVASAVLLLRRAGRTNTVPGVLVFSGVAWFFVTLSVESSIIPIRDVIFEHRLYLPSAGAAIAVGTMLLWAIERLRFTRSVQAALALLVTAGPLSAATYARNFVWKDELALWSDTVAKSPDKARPHNMLGVEYRAEGRLDDAIREYQQAIRVDHSMAEAYNNLGDAFQLKGELENAENEYREAIRIEPALAVAHYNLGLACEARGRIEEAEHEYREALRLEPELRLVAHVSLGRILIQLGRADEAVEHYRHALETKSRPDIVISLAEALEAAGRRAEALTAYQDFIDEWGREFPHRAETVAGRIARIRASSEPVKRERWAPQTSRH